MALTAAWHPPRLARATASSALFRTASATVLYLASALDYASPEWVTARQNWLTICRIRRACPLQDRDDNRGMDQELLIADLDKTRRQVFSRSESRPISRTGTDPRNAADAVQQARGRLRQAAYRCNLDRRKAPEAAVVGAALIAAVVSMRKSELDVLTLKVVSAAISDLIDRGYDRHEVENVFRRTKQRRQSSTVPRKD